MTSLLPVFKALSDENAKLEARANLLESGGTAAYAAQLKLELTARLVGIMQGEQGIRVRILA